MSLTPYAHLTPMTDTVELPAVLRGAEPPTAEVWPPAPVPAPAAPVRLPKRLRRSRFLGDCRDIATNSLGAALVVVAAAGLIVAKVLDAAVATGIIHG